MSVRRILWLTATAVVLAACTSGRADDKSTPTASTSTRPAPSPSQTLTTAAELAKAMHAGVDPVTSAKVDFTGTYSGFGTATFADGRLTALDTVGAASSATYAANHVIISRGAAYLRPEDLDGKPAGPWRRLTAASSDAATRKVATSAAAAYGLADLDPLIDAVGAATSFEDTGLSIYGLDSFPSTARLSSLFGESVVPTRVSVTLGVNGRPRSVMARLTVGGTFCADTVELSAFNVPVTITPPTASETTGP